jgi:hypothetical protein
MKDLLHGPSTVARMFLQRLVAERLHDVEVLSARLAGVFIGGHSLSPGMIVVGGYNAL